MSNKMTTLEKRFAPMHCQNTLTALNEIVEQLQYQGELFIEQLSDDEREAFEDLFYVAEQFITLSEYPDWIRDQHITEEDIID